MNTSWVRRVPVAALVCVAAAACRDGSDEARSEGESAAPTRETGAVPTATSETKRGPADPAMTDPAPRGTPMRSKSMGAAPMGTSPTPMQSMAGARSATPIVADAPPCPDPNHVAGTPGCLSAEAFEATQLRRFELTIAPADRELMPRLAAHWETENTYVPAQLKVDGEDLGMVGVRYKGAWGTLQTCIDSDFTLVCDKMSYKIKFDEYDSDKRWKRLKKVNLHSMRADPTLMHEHLGYALFRDMGVAAPRSTHATLSVNGEPAGVFAQTEAPDGRFTADRFAPNGDGNLYKEVWPSRLEGSHYGDALETNEDVAQDHVRFVEFASALTRAPRGQLADVVRRFTDPDYLLRYVAVDRVLSNWDGATTFYCDDETSGRCENHNLYWYLDEAGERFSLIPWDLDNTWKLTTDHEAIMPRWNELPADCNTRVQWNDSWLMPPGCDPLFQGLAELGTDAYAHALDALLAGPLQVATLHAEIDRIALLIGPAVASDPTLDVAAWKQRVAELKDVAGWVCEKAALMRDGKDYRPFGVRPSGVNDFETTPGATFAMGSKVDPNPGTTARRSINRDAPISGASDVRIDFEYRTQGRPYAWLKFAIGMQGTPVSLASTRHMQVSVKADREREVRIELDGAGEQVGWSVKAGPQPSTLMLDFAALGSPSGDPSGALDAIEGLLIQVEALGLGDDGYFPAGASDPGFVQLDDLAFLP